MDLPSLTSEAVHENEAEFDVIQMVQLSSQISPHDTAPWILTSRAPPAPKKPVDTRFVSYMADIRRQNNGSDADGTGSTPRVSLILPCVSPIDSFCSVTLRRFAAFGSRVSSDAGFLPEGLRLSGPFIDVGVISDRILIWKIVTLSFCSPVIF